MMVFKTNSKQKTVFATVAVSACLLVAATAILLFIGQDAGTVPAMSATGRCGRLEVEVLDGFSETPIAGAAVVIPENNNVYYTDENGHIRNIKVPVILDTRFDNILKKPWGEVTLIVYKEGYMPYALFYLQVLPGQTRKGVQILLFEEGSTGSGEPFSIIEGPNRLWVNEMIEKYRPKT